MELLAALVILAIVLVVGVALLFVEELVFVVLVASEAGVEVATTKQENEPPVCPLQMLPPRWLRVDPHCLAC